MQYQAIYTSISTICDLINIILLTQENTVQYSFFPSKLIIIYVDKVLFNNNC